MPLTSPDDDDNSENMDQIQYADLSLQTQDHELEERGYEPVAQHSCIYSRIGQNTSNEEDDYPYHNHNCSSHNCRLEDVSEGNYQEYLSNNYTDNGINYDDDTGDHDGDDEEEDSTIETLTVPDSAQPGFLPIINLPTCNEDHHQWTLPTCIRCGVRLIYTGKAYHKLIQLQRSLNQIRAGLCLLMIMFLLGTLLPTCGAVGVSYVNTPLDGNSQTNKVQRSHTLSAYDCSSPRGIQKYQLPDAEWCYSSTKRTKKLTKSTSSWTLLQKVKTVDVGGYRCKAVRTKFVFLCGMFSHLSLGGHPEIEIEMPLSTMDCQRMVAGSFRNLDIDHPIQEGSQLLFWTNEDGELVQGSSTVTCKGEEDKISGKMTEKVVSLEQWRVTLEKVTLRTNFRATKIVENNEEIRCLFGARSCEGPTSTVVWNYSEHNKCPLRIVRKFEGSPHIIGTELVLVDHTNKLRLVLGKTLQECEL